MAVPEFCDAVATLDDPTPGLRLVTSVRPIHRMNHWIGEPHPPVATVHPTTAAEGSAELVGPAGTLPVQVAHDASLPPDVVLVPYGPGPANPNRLVSATDLEAFTGQPISNGTIVELRRDGPRTD